MTVKPLLWAMHVRGRSQLFASLGFVFLNITMQSEHDFPFQVNSNNRFLTLTMRNKHGTSLQNSLSLRSLLLHFLVNPRQRLGG